MDRRYLEQPSAPPPPPSYESAVTNSSSHRQDRPADFTEFVNRYES